MSQDTPKTTEIKPEEVASQFMVIRTHDNRVAVQFPTKKGGDMDGIETLKLLATGLHYVVDTLVNQQQSRIVLAPAIPPEFLTKERL